MRKAIKCFPVLLVLSLLATALMVPVSAASFQFTVAPILPSNQRPTDVGYFDLAVTPGHKQDLSVVIENPTAEAIVLSIEAFTSSTNRNGIINHTSQGPLDEETLQYSMRDLLKVDDPTVIVEANSQKTVTVHLAVPDQPFDGVLFGSIYVLKGLTEAERNSGDTILNQYSYVIAVKLTEDETPIAPDFALGDITADLDNGRATILVNVRNPKPAVIKEAVVTAKIYPQGSDITTIESTKDNVTFAPNSIFTYSLTDQAGFGLQAGQYLTKVEVEHAGQTWNFEKEFTIRADEAANINRNASNQTQHQQNAVGRSMNLPLWLIIVIVVAIILLIVALAILIPIWWSNRKYYSGLK